MLAVRIKSVLGSFILLLPLPQTFTVAGLISHEWFTTHVWFLFVITLFVEFCA